MITSWGDRIPRWAKWAIIALLIPLAAYAGWAIAPKPEPPNIWIRSVDVTPLKNTHGTLLEIKTVYDNTGCDQILLARFLLNSKPTPSIALTQQQGPVVLPATSTEVVESISLGFQLGEGQWHMFSVASCYRDGLAVPHATVSPTALFDVE